MAVTNDQYLALDQLKVWYRKYSKQFIEISGIVGTGTWEVVQEFIEATSLDPREVIYLSYDQKQVLELAYQGFHAYYFNAIYRYTRITNFDSLALLNAKSPQIEYLWKKEVKDKFSSPYKLMIIFDSMLLTLQNIKDLATLSLPIILIRDPMLLPVPNSYTFLRDADIILREINPKYNDSLITYFTQKIIRGDKIDYGSYGEVAVVPRKQLNFYNLRSADMIITLSEEVSGIFNQIYREQIIKAKGSINTVGERVIVAESLYDEVLKNKDNKKVKVYLSKGLIGSLSKVIKHAVGTRYIRVDLKPDGYHESFSDLSLDRFYLNRISASSRQEIPKEILQVEYAYALSAPLARNSHWDRTTVIFDSHTDDELETRLKYTAVTRTRKAMTLVL